MVLLDKDLDMLAMALCRFKLHPLFLKGIGISEGLADEVRLIFRSKV